MAQIKLAQLAEEKTTSQEVKDFAKRMVTDHTKADEQLKSAATNDKITLPSTLNTKEQATYDHLSKLSGEAFDRAYARDMVADHRTDIAAFRSESDNGKDVSIKGFASQTLPTLETHLKLARTMLQEVSKTSSNKKTNAPSGD